MDIITKAFVEWWKTNRWGGEREHNAAFEGFQAGWKLALAIAKDNIA